MRNDRTAYSSRRVQLTPSVCVLVSSRWLWLRWRPVSHPLVPVSSLSARGPHLWGLVSMYLQHRVRTYSEPSGLLSLCFGLQGQTCYLCTEGSTHQFSAERRARSLCCLFFSVQPSVTRGFESPCLLFQL